MTGGPRSRSLKRPPRVAVRIDMLPMASMAFLLLLSQTLVAANQIPRTIELSLPPRADRGTPIAQSKVLTLWVDRGPGQPMKLQWERGGGELQDVSLGALGKTLRAEAIQTDDMIVNIKVERTVSYEHFIKLLDQLHAVGIDEFGLRRWSDGEPFFNRRMIDMR